MSFGLFPENLLANKKRRCAAYLWQGLIEESEEKMGIS